MLEKGVPLVAVLCLFLMVLLGCTAPLALQGLGSATPMAFNPTGRGEGDSAWLARYDDVLQATLQAAQVLDLEVGKKEIGEGQAAFQFVDGRGKKMNVLIQHRTKTVTSARFSVGLFGSRAMGQLLVRQIILELNRGGKFIRDAHPVEVD
jgi:hypothetical protein